MQSRVRVLWLACLRAFGYLAFGLALWALSATAKLLGEEHDLGYFAGRLSATIRRYPEVTRPGAQMARLAWIALFVLAISPLDPISTWWDEVLLGAVALGVVWHRTLGPPRAGR